MYIYLHTNIYISICLDIKYIFLYISRYVCVSVYIYMVHIETEGRRGGRESVRAREGEREGKRDEYSQRQEGERNTCNSYCCYFHYCFRRTRAHCHALLYSAMIIDPILPPQNRWNGSPEIDRRGLCGGQCAHSLAACYVQGVASLYSAPPKSPPPAHSDLVRATHTHRH